MLKKPPRNKLKKQKHKPKMVPNKTLKNDQCRYCKETGHMMADCPKFAKRCKLEDPDTEKCQNCNTPGHEEENCYLAHTWKTDRPNGL